MTAGHLLLAFAVGTAALALWAHVRWPSAAPDTMRGAIVRVLLALVLLQVGLGALHIGLEAAPSLAVIVVTGAVLPVLTYTFLASIWFLKVLADRMRGAF